MKTVFVLLIFFCVITLPTFAELTVQGIEKIDAKIKASETRIIEYVNASETRIIEYVNASETRITENTNAQIEGVRALITWIIGLFVGLIVLIGLPFLAYLF